MNRKLKKLVSLLSASLIAAGALVGISATSAIAAPVTIDFESSPSSYILTSFGGASSTVEAPTSTLSGSTQSLKFTKGADCWSGSTFAELNGTEFISTGNNVVTAKVYSTRAVIARLKIEDFSNSTTFLEADATLTTNGWQDVTWTFTIGSTNAVNYDKATIFFDFWCGGSAASPSNYYLDNLVYQSSATTVTPIVRPSVLTSFESDDSFTHTVASACSATASIVRSSSGVLGSANAGKISTWGAGDCSALPLWAFVTLPVGQSLISSSNRTVTMSFYSPSGGERPVLKVERDSNTGLTAQSNETSIVAGWQTLTFTFAPSTDRIAYNQAVLFPRGIGAMPVAALTYYFDNVSFNGVVAAQATVSGEPEPTSKSTGFFDSDNKSSYPHIRLAKEFLDTKFDASWWDGVWQYRDPDSKAYLKYLSVGSTFSLTYVVTGSDNMPLSNSPVSLIVNANSSCSKTFFLYENTLIGPDDCAGGGQTELPAKMTDGEGRVTFVLTNTNAVGEAMPLDLNGLPNGKVEVGTNIKPHLVGATKEGIDMLFAHFVQPTEKASVSAPAASSVAAGGNAWSTFTFTDENGAAIANTEVAFMINGFESKTGYAKTDASGKVVIRSANPTSATGQQVVAVSLIRPGKLPITGSTKVNWISPVVTLAASGAKGAVVVSVTSANGKSVKISIGGKVYTRTATSDSAKFSIPATAGAKRVVVTVGTKSVTKTVTVSK